MSADIATHTMSTNIDWHKWCRLCAKCNPLGNVSVFQTNEHKRFDATMAAAIGKYFWVNIKIDDTLSRDLCKNCHILMTELIKFAERVNKVQAMYCVLQNIGTNTTVNPNDVRRQYLEDDWEHIIKSDNIVNENEKRNTEYKVEVTQGLDQKHVERVTKVQQMFAVLLNSTKLENLELRAMRQKFGLLDEEREHMLIHQRLPEVHYFEEKPKMLECVNEDRNQSLLDDVNPLESSAQCLTIKQEFVAVDDNDNNEDLSDHERLRNDQVQEGLLSNEFDIQEDSNNVDKFHSSEKCQPNADSDFDVSDTQNDMRVRNRLTRKKKSIKQLEQNVELDDSSDNETNDKIGKVHVVRKHVNQNSSNEAYPCGQCPRVFNRRSNLERHAKVHLPLASRKVIPCPYCEKKFLSNTLKSHVSYKHMNQNQRVFICEECGITSRTNAALKEHMLTHTDYAPFECEVCKKSFKSHTRLKLHMEIHDPKKHICAKCGLQLNSRATLNRHLLVHSDVMQHKCDYCGRAFKRAKALKNHLLLHTGLKPYSCDFCDRTFGNGANCRSHKKKAHPEELAALEAAGGGKTYTKNIPKLEALKAVTKTADNLAPVVSKQSGNFAFGKRPKTNEAKLTANSSKSNSTQSLNAEEPDKLVDSSAEFRNEPVSPSIPTLDNIYARLTKHSNQSQQQLSDIKTKIDEKSKECNAGRINEPTESECKPNHQLVNFEHSHATSVNFFDSIRHNLQQPQQHPLAPYI